jgi:hypothetical protein
MVFDFTQAYLNADIKETVFVRLDPIATKILCNIDPSYKDYVLDKGDMLIVNLNEALYGRVESLEASNDQYRHIKLRYFFVKQYLDDGSFGMVHCPTNHVMIADVLTKPLQGELFTRFRVDHV